MLTDVVAAEELFVEKVLKIWMLEVGQGAFMLQ
jgi:hypothetical protein